MPVKWTLFLLVACFMVAAPCQAVSDTTKQLPNALDFLPPPPQENSADFVRDKALYEQTRALKGSERWKQATFDADIPNNAPYWFKDAFGLELTKENAPSAYALLILIFDTVHVIQAPAKAHYKRTRPFVYYDDLGATCAPGDEATLRNNGSFPSGHTSRGWSVALVLAEISPERQNAILKRGWELGQSRVICGVHWQSDVDAGRLVAASAVASLRNSPEFNDLLAKAKKEVHTLRAQPQ